ncbi:MAG: hypothetical protein M3305_01520 [Actinomycetota bacterium]|nr:hypothetical protein [Actinomycetota bacterium]
MVDGGTTGQASHPAAPPEAAEGRRCEADEDRRERPSAPRRERVVDPEIKRGWYDADGPAWPAPITAAS